jgi:uncharacterized protein YjdB
MPLNARPKSVDSVIVGPATSLLLAVNRTQALTATPLDRDGRPNLDSPIIWASAAPSIATVSSSGVLNGVAEGGTTITATSNGRTTAIRVGITAVQVATLGVEPKRATIAINETLQLQLGGRDSTGALVLVWQNSALSWSSLDPNVATVNSSGLVHPVTTGIARIVLSAENRLDTAYVTIALRQLSFSPASVSLGVGQSATEAVFIGYTATDPVTVSLTSSDPSIATVTSTATVNAGASFAIVTLTGAASGNATISATSPGFTGASSAITVGTGTLTTRDWPTTLALGDSVLITLYTADASGTTRTLAAPVTFTLNPSTNLVFTNGSSTIGTITVPAGTSGTSFYVKAIASGSGSATITGPGYTPYSAPVVTVP